ncbi:MAG: DUF2760 domain-containing protein [Gammaproteobacteria bacterium]|jgi:hypothetical protein
MAEPKLSFSARLRLAFRVFFRSLSDADFANVVRNVASGEASAIPKTPQGAEAVPMPRLKEATPESALQLLGLLQQGGRLVDFLEEDVSHYSDEEIGAAARVVHEGCRKVIHEHLEIEPVRAEDEGSRITLESGFDASSIRVTGNVMGQPPFIGTLVHRGWQTRNVRLPKLAQGHEVGVLAPAEVEL